jgi:tetratricopeptide (TPR) repeat protein
MRRALMVALFALAAATPRTLAAQFRVARAESSDTSYDAIVRRAERASMVARWVEAADLWDWAIATDDRTPEHWWKLGNALFNANRHRESIAVFERALQLGAGEPATGAWQISRAYAHRGNKSQALRWLARAVELGFDKREILLQEPLFEQYRDDPRFQRSCFTGAAGLEPATSRVTAGRSAN